MAYLSRTKLAMFVIMNRHFTPHVIRAGLASEHHHCQVHAQDDQSGEYEADGREQADVATRGSVHVVFPSRPGAPNRASGHEGVTTLPRRL
jgi:hypothetical protein